MDFRTADGIHVFHKEAYSAASTCETIIFRPLMIRSSFFHSVLNTPLTCKNQVPCQMLRRAIGTCGGVKENQFSWSLPIRTYALKGYPGQQSRRLDHTADAKARLRLSSSRARFKSEWTTTVTDRTEDGRMGGGSRND
ncbi:hypothetical protein F2P81_004185 [Scophthalmus maximus]|uniref:Uncharacterized protein n=1 Tax=Scophthalmus maximus TaxID=52904 RepID=A0A6A4TEJ7_SCOMX|nr:hypothetical protein F2P81_004185 [Scophthalmus maximus]